MDIVGPIHPVTDKGNRYILTLVGFATRYPEAIPMHSFETERVAGALIDIFSRVEVPVELLSDMGSEFTSSIMREVSRFLSLNQLTTTPYHPMTNGMVERFNGIVKQMLKRMCADRPCDWDKYINPVLFAYREVQQESTTCKRADGDIERSMGQRNRKPPGEVYLPVQLESKREA